MGGLSNLFFVASSRFGLGRVVISSNDCMYQSATLLIGATSLSPSGSLPSSSTRCANRTGSSSDKNCDARKRVPAVRERQAVDCSHHTHQHSASHQIEPSGARTRPLVGSSHNGIHCSTISQTPSMTCWLIQALRPGSGGDNNMARESKWSCVLDIMTRGFVEGAGGSTSLPTSDLPRLCVPPRMWRSSGRRVGAILLPCSRTI